MINLSSESGLEIFLKDNGELDFGEKVLKVPPQIRFFSEVRDFFRDKKANFSKGDILYYMYRGVAKKSDSDFFKKRNWRYDLTVILPGLIGEEFNKTIGHFHNFAEGKNFSYPEVYQVIFGKALFLIQKINYQNEEVEKVWIIEASQGDKVVIPRQENFLFGHTTVNIGNDFLVLANLQNLFTIADYSFYRQNRGAIYYVLHNPNKNSKEYLLIPNSCYSKHPVPEISKGERSFGVFHKFDSPLYQEAISHPNKFSFLDL
jgi:glucose-6-phosphate isomerase